ncbi:unnamed protein product, partial [Prunus brigantina]
TGTESCSRISFPIIPSFKVLNIVVLGGWILRVHCKWLTKWYNTLNLQRSL